MNYNELRQLRRQCDALGIRTGAELKAIKRLFGITNNITTINIVNILFVHNLKINL